MLLKNGIIHDAVNPKPYEADISIQDGKIAAIGQGLQPAPGEEVIDLTGRAVYPGFVDAHSHLGLDNYGMGFEGHDYNEMGDIVSAQLRGIDGFNPQDKSIWPSTAASPASAPARAAPTSSAAPSSPSKLTATASTTWSSATPSP